MALRYLDVEIPPKIPQGIVIYIPLAPWNSTLATFKQMF